MCDYRIQVSKPIVGGRSHVCCLMSVYPLLLQPQIFIFSKEPDPDSHLHVQTRIKIVLNFFLKA